MRRRTKRRSPQGKSRVAVRWKSAASPASSDGKRFADGEEEEEEEEDEAALALGEIPCRGTVEKLSVTGEL